MYSQMIDAWASSSRGKVVLGIWAATLAGASLKAVVSRLSKASEKGKKPELKDAPKRRKRSATEDEESMEAEDGDKKEPVKPSRRLMKLALGGKHRTWTYVTLLSIGIVARCLVGIKVSGQIGKMGSLVAVRDWDAMYASQISFALWCLPAAGFNALVTFCEKRLALGMRSNLVEHLHANTAEGRQLVRAVEGLENPDAVSTADVEKLGNTMASLFTGLTRPTVEILLLSGRLAGLMGFSQLATCYVYFVGSVFWIRTVVPSFKALTKEVAAKDGAYRATHSRVAQFAPEVEMMQGVHAEVGIMRRAYNKLSSVLSAFQLQEMMSDMLNGYTVRYMGILAAYATMLPAVYYGTDGVTTAGADPSEYMLECLHLLVNIGIACRDLALSGRAFGVIRGLSERIARLSRQLTKPSRSTIQENDQGVVEFKNVTLCAPDGRELVKDVCFQTANRSVFLRGPNGVGKTTLLRVMAGTASAATGVVNVPRRIDCFYIPQRSYLIPGTLREQLMYPHSPDLSDPLAVASKEAYGDKCPLAAIDDAAMLKVLCEVKLGFLAEQAGILDSTDACEGLSAGEQQRLAIARMLLHRPKWAMLDECTNTLTEDFERWVYEHCRAVGISLFTVSHRTSLRAYHDFELSLLADGSATFAPVTNA